MRPGLRWALAVTLLLVLAGIAAMWWDAQPKGRPTVVRPPTARAASRADTGARPAAPVVAPAADTARVVCRYLGDGDAGELRATGEADPVTTPASGNVLAADLEPGTWALTWVRAGPEGGRRLRALGRVDLAAGDVLTCELGDAGLVVRGRVVNPDGEPVPGADVAGCRSRGVSDENGAFTLAVAVAGDCTLQATWRDGLLTRFGEPHPFLGLHEPPSIELVVDDTPIAGLGITIRAVEGGILVDEVQPDSPAWNAGIEAGDVVVAVDGRSTAGMDVRDFIALGTGREGSRATLRVDMDGVEREVEVRRARIPPADDDER